MHYFDGKRVAAGCKGHQSSCENVSPKLVGVACEVPVIVDGKSCHSLLDSGSMVSTVSHSFCLQHGIDIHPLNNILDIIGAGGHSVPYLGYTEVNVSVSDSLQSCAALLLAVPDTPYNKIIPIIIGTNIMPQLLLSLDHGDPSLMSDAWKLAAKCLQHSNTISVKSTRTVTVPAGEKVIFNGLSHVPTSSPVLSLRQMAIEHADHSGLPGNLVLTPGLFNITFAERTCRVPIQVFNTSDREIIIPANVMVGNLVAVNNVVPLSEQTGSLMDSQISMLSQQCSSSNTPVSDFLSKFNIDEISRHLSSVQVSEVTNLLQNWQMAFSQHDMDLGHTTSVKHHIKLTDETPFKQRHRRIPHSQYESIKKHLQEMLHLGVIRPSESPFASNIVLVTKKDGSLRFCIDLRKLNEKTVKDSYALPRIEETLDVLGGAQWFSVLDLKSAYWQVEIAEEDKAKTAFTVGPLGFYECNRMPFGLTNAPATFQRLIETCMSDIHLSQCLLYLDDIVIFSRSYEEHLSRLEAVLKRLAASGLKLHPSKCHLFQREIRYLGHIVSASGVATDPDKINAVKSWPAPTNVDELRRFLGFIGFYRRFIQDFAKIARPLHNLLGGPIKKRRGKQNTKQQPVYHWGQMEQESFEQLIHRCCTAPVLAYADYNKPFIVHTDASKDGLGAVLYQIQDGEERAVAYASRSLSISEKNYPAHKMEFLALKWAIVDKFHDYLYGNKFLVRTDNNPLTYILTTAKLDATGHRWVSELSNFDFSIKYRPGRQNKDADALSRLPNNVSNSSCLLSGEVVSACIQMAEVLVDALVEATCFSHAVASEAAAPVFGVQSLSRDKWKKLQHEDPVIHQVVSVLNETFHSDKLDIDAKKLWHQTSKLTLKGGVLYRQRQGSNGSSVLQLVLPKKYHTEALNSVHDQMGHMGRERTLDLLTARFYWTNISNDVADYVASCDRCLRRKSLTTQKAPLVNITTSYPLELVSIDYLTLETSKGGFENILVVMDHFTRYAQAYPTRNQTAKTTARVLFDNFICHYGFPARIHSDQGRNFMSKTIEHLCQMTGIEKSRTTPYHAMGNGQVERFNRTLLGMLGTMEPIKKSDWKTYVPSLVHAYNCTKHESTEYSPFFLMFGRQPRLPVDLLLGSADDNEDGNTYEDYVNTLRDRLRSAYDLAASHVAKAQKSQKQRYDLKARCNRVVIGDRVLIRNVGLQGKNKLADRWKEDVFLVISQPQPEIPVFEVKPEAGRGRKRVLHRNLLLPISSIPVVENSDKPEVIVSDGYPDVGSVEAGIIDINTSVDQLDDSQTTILPIAPPIVKPTPTPRRSLHSHNIIPPPIVYSSTEDESNSDSDDSCISEASRQPPIPKPRRSTRLRQLPTWFDPAAYQMDHIVKYENGVLFIPTSDSH